MWQYNYDYYDLAPDELMHYGKLTSYTKMDGRRVCKGTIWCWLLG